MLLYFLLLGLKLAAPAITWWLHAQCVEHFNTEVCRLQPEAHEHCGVDNAQDQREALQGRQDAVGEL